MNELQIFNNPQFGEIRTAGTADNPLFCLADVCKAVGLTNPSNVKARLDKEDVQLIDLHALNSTEGQIIGNSMTNFVTESGFYDVILQSSSPNVKPFRKWVTSEVLPSIRKTGGYTNPAYQLPQSYADALRELAGKVEENERLMIENQQKQAALVEAGEQISAMSYEIEQMKPKVSYYDLILNNKSTVLITQIAQDYGLSAKGMNKILQEMHIQHKVGGQWILYADYLRDGYVQSKSIDIVHSNGYKSVKYNTEWTQKGRIFLYEQLKSRGILPLIECKQETSFQQQFK
jgi:prophage antirepressor-like protein